MKPMKRGNSAGLILFAAIVGMAGRVRGAVIAEWTFETAPPSSAGPISADYVSVGTAQATASHAGSSTYSSPAGNGSSHSYSSTNWAVGDYYQFTANTTGNSNIQFMFDQTGSSTGPGQFQLEYSTTGTSFSTFGSPYTVLVNGAPNAAWNSSTTSSGFTTTVNLSSITALNNDSAVYFRLVDASTTSTGGGTVGTSGTDRVDNVIIEPVPTLASLGLAVSTNALNSDLLLGAPASDFSGVATLTNSGSSAGNYTASSPDSSLTLSGVGSSVPANSSATFGYTLSSLPLTYGIYNGNLSVAPSGTANDTTLVSKVSYFVGNPSADNSNSTTTFGQFTYIADIPANGSFAGLASKVFGTTGSGGAGALGSTAIIRYGTNTSSAAETVGEVWRTRTQAELAIGALTSDVVKVTGIPINTLYVLQVSYTPTNTSLIEEIGQYISGNYFNAASENYSGSTYYIGNVPWSSAYVTLGDFGYDSSNDVAWAVLDHGGTFAVTAVPEPASLGLLVFGAAGLLRRQRSIR